jgi:tRNA-dihydrouridine synthase
MLNFYGIVLGCRVSRKHLGWYMDDIGTSRDLRRAIQTEKKPEMVLSLIERLHDDRELAA